MIEINNLNVRLSKKNILKNLTADFDNGIYGLLGQNGAGKTTLIRSISGYYQVNDGCVKISRDMKIGYLPQYFNSFKHLTCNETLEYYYHIKKLPKADKREHISTVLKLVNLLENADKKVGAFSGGMLRRLGLAQAMLGDPQILLLDEPTSGLDPEERLRFKNILKGFDSNKLILLSTHIVSDIEGICEKIFILHHGEKLFSGTQQDLVKIAERPDIESSFIHLTGGHEWN